MIDRFEVFIAFCVREQGDFAVRCVMSSNASLWTNWESGPKVYCASTTVAQRSVVYAMNGFKDTGVIVDMDVGVLTGFIAKAETELLEIEGRWKGSGHWIDQHYGFGYSSRCLGTLWMADV